MRNRRERHSERGSALVVAIVIVAILAVVGLALTRRTTNEMEAVGGKRYYDSAVTCADGAREMLLSQFRTSGMGPTSLTLDQTVDTKRMTSGHYDQFAMATIVPAAGTLAGAVGVNDIANRISRASLGGQIYRMSVVCTDSSGTNRQSEVEFLVRFGL